MIWFLATFGSFGIIGMAVDHGSDRDALYTMVGHIAIFGTVLLNYKQTRSNGAKLDAAKIALRGQDNP